MTRVVLRGLAARRLRLALTALAVALGVTLIAGTYVFTDTINQSFDRIFSEAYRGTDVAVVPGDDVQTDDGGLPPIDASVLATVRGVPGVGVAEGSIFDPGGTILGRDGEPLGTGGAPNFVGSIHDAERFGSFQISEGRMPRTAAEAAIDKFTADREGFSVGDTVSVQADQPRKAYRIVGIVRISGVDSFGGAAVALLTLPEAQRMTGKVGQVDEISVALAAGAAAEEVVGALREALPRSVAVRTGTEQADEQSATTRDSLSFLRTALLAFAGISLFVGAFIIFNTFSITVAQRTREFGLLRTLGASRRQILSSVMAESLVLGLLGAAAGLALGIVVAAGLRELFKAVGADLPSDGSVLLTRTIVVSLLVGTVVTVLSSLAPALRATRVPPIAALREGTPLPRGRGARWATPLAVALVGVAVALLLAGLFGGASDSAALSMTGAGAALLFVGVALLSPRLVPPIATVVGGPIERVAGVTGRLARANSVRLPGRTAATAAALMIGVALVAFASIFAASARTTIRSAVEGSSKAQVIVQHTNGFGAFTPEVARTLDGLDGVEVITGMGRTNARIAGEDRGVTGIDPTTFTRLYDTGEDAAAFRSLGPGEALLREGFAEDRGLEAGDPLTARTTTGRTLRLRVAGVVADEGQLLAAVTVREDELREAFGMPRHVLVLAGFRGGEAAPALEARIDELLADRFPQVEARSNEEFIDDQAGQVDQLLGLIYALLGLAVIVSLFGIVNTLVLSITERTRELGMLRAIGTSRRQVRRMIRYEAVITAMIGGILGAALGVLLALLVSRVVEDLTLTVPAGEIAVLVALSGLAGVGAAVLPARRAARLDVLEALAYE